MVYSRKMLQNDERREQIAKELDGVTWQMKIRSVADTYVFFEHPDFKDHVFRKSIVSVTFISKF